MSHGKHRKEKNCLNCGAIVQGNFCQDCGQENLEPRETFWHMVAHFFYDITHFDSSFFHTVHHLIWRPGFLSREYLAGRRASYLHPVRMYVFSSAIFFILFFGFFAGNEAIRTNLNQLISPEQRAVYIQKFEKELKADTGNARLKNLLSLVKDSTRLILLKDLFILDEDKAIITFSKRKYRSVVEYDSIQGQLAPSEKDGWITRRVFRKIIDINTRYRENPDEIMHELGKSILHRLPYMLLISLPLFALILKLVYFRRKQFYYADHGVFTIHLYVFTFVMLALIFTLNKLADIKGFGFVGVIIFLLVMALLFYLYMAMKRFYGQGRAKTLVKWIFVVFTSLIMMLILFALIMFFSAATI